MLAGFHESHPSLSFRAMDDIKPPGTLDREWLVDLPDDPPHIVITKDEALLKESGQLRAWISGGLTVIIFGSEFANLKREEMATTMFRWWPTILRTITANPRGRAFQVPTTYREMDQLPAYIPPQHRRRPRKPRRVRGARGSGGTTVPPPSAQLRLPFQIAVEASGNLNSHPSQGGSGPTTETRSPDRTETERGEGDTPTEGGNPP